MNTCCRIIGRGAETRIMTDWVSGLCDGLNLEQFRPWFVLVQMKNVASDLTPNICLCVTNEKLIYLLKRWMQPDQFGV